jgi:hypothetical protein
MSPLQAITAESPTLHCPRPRRTPEFASLFPDAPRPQPSPSEFTSSLDTKDSSLQRSSSTCNLTTSTLYGIYSSSMLETPREASTACGIEVHSLSRLRNNAQLPATLNPIASPAETMPVRRPYRIHDALLSFLLKSILLFGFGVVYGTIIAHLHENRWITPVKMEVIDGHSSQYLGLWGIGGVALGSVLPWLDMLWKGFSSCDDVPKLSISGSNAGRHESAHVWSRWGMTVRSIGTFVGIAFAMVSVLPCQLLTWCKLISISAA